MLRCEWPDWLGAGAILGGPALNRKGIEDARFAVVLVGGAVVDDLGLNGNSEKCIVRILSITKTVLSGALVTVFRLCLRGCSGISYLKL